MAKKSVTTQELANIYPWWTKVRSNDQSVGFQFLNALAKPMEDMDKQLEKMKKNEFLSTINLDEIDLTYKVQLPTTFEFDLDTSDPTNPVSLPPTVRGLVITSEPVYSGYVSVTLADDNDVKSFWYDSVPNRATLAQTASGETTLLSQPAGYFPYSGLLEHHLVDDNEGGGRIWIECTGGTEYIQKNDRNEVQRGRVVLKGTTRKGTNEEETIVFPWDEKQPSLKEWRRLTDVNVYDIESGVNVEIRSADFNEPPYWSFYNLRYSDNRTKVDEFWKLNDAGTKLDRVGYIADEWQQILLGFSETEVKESWDLIGTGWEDNAEGVDIAVQPFSDKVWMVTEDGTLYCYALEESMASGVSYLQERSEGPLAQIYSETRRVTKDEDIIIMPWHARPIKEIRRWRIWFQDPDGNKYGISAGEPVSYTSDFWETGLTIKRVIADEITVTAEKRGEYLFVLETEYVDGTEDEDRLLVQVQFKVPLAVINISDIVTLPVEGIDFDSDQKMWIKANGDFFQLELHTDVMLIDYEGKILYFKESYSDVEVTV